MLGKMQSFIQDSYLKKETIKYRHLIVSWFELGWTLRGTTGALFNLSPFREEREN